MRVPFDPAREALVFARGDIGGWLVENSALPVAYARNANIPGYRHLATRLASQAICAKVRSEPALVAVGVDTFGFFDDSDTVGGRFETRLCELHQPEDPMLPTVMVDRTERAFTVDGLPVTGQITTIATPDGRHYVLRGGVAAPLPWLPLPVLGCALDSGAPAWRCFHQFQRSGFTPLATTGPRDRRDEIVLVRALGLARVAPADRRAADGTAVFRSIAATRERLVVAATAKLDAVLADPATRVAPRGFDALRGRTDILLPRLERIVAVVDRQVAVGGVTADNVGTLSDLLRQVPVERLNASRRAVRWGGARRSAPTPAIAIRRAPRSR